MALTDATAADNDYLDLCPALSRKAQSDLQYMLVKSVSQLLQRFFISYPISPLTFPKNLF